MPSMLSAHPNPANQLIGEILISQQWVTPSQLAEAVAEHKRTNQRLGEIMVRLGHLSEMELTFILSQQKGNTLTGDADTVKQRLGDILKKSKRLSPRELGRAVAEQKRTNEKLGEVLLRMGMLDEDELNAVLAWQGDFNQADPMAVRLLLGEILIASKKLGRKQLVDALATQKMTRKQIGQVLLDAGLVSKLDIRNALGIQTKMVAASLLAMMSMASLSGCGTPVVPTQPKFGASVDYSKKATGARYLAFDTTAPYRVAALSGGRQLKSFNDGSRVVSDVPFFHQGQDNTCAQAVLSVVLNFWGKKQGYQDLVNAKNAWNLPTTTDGIIATLKGKGLDAKAYREGNLGYIKSLIDQGRPPIALLEFNNDLLQQHYVVVVGYNEAKGSIIFHDSIDGPYSQLSEDDFTAMWQAKHLVNLPVLGGGNYRGLVIDVSAPQGS